MPLDFRPDLDPYSPGLLTRCEFAIPKYDGAYGSPYAASTSGYDTALASAALGSAICRKANGTPRLLVGTDSKIYEADGAGGYTDRARSTGYTTGSYAWWFTAHDDSVVACNYANETQISTGAGFTDLANAPKARVIVSQNGALLAMNYDDGSAVPNGIKISARGSTTTWTAAGSNDAAALVLRQTAGPIIAGAVIQDVVVAWKRRSMYVGRYVGGADKWQFNLVSQYIGCVGQEAWAYTPKGIIFLGERGVYIFDGSMPRPVDNGIREYLFGNISINGYNQGQDAFVTHDESQGCVFIWHRSAVSTWSALAYNYNTDRWSRAYLSNVIGGGAVWTGFQCAVRDANYNDHVLLNGVTNSLAVAHLIYSSEKKLTNLAATTATFTAVFNTGRIRLDGMTARQKTKLRRIIPIWREAKEPGVLSGVALVSPTLSVFQRRSKSAADSTPTATHDTTMNVIDAIAIGDNFKLALSVTVTDGAEFGLSDLEWELEPGPEV